uniref:Uncharacterized protein n=1 Tax=Rhizophora mucronata TaxID=61149 RepID=A0A2P2NPA3_RHIMU
MEPYIHLKTQVNS